MRDIEKLGINIALINSIEIKLRNKTNKILEIKKEYRRKSYGENIMEIKHITKNR